MSVEKLLYRGYTVESVANQQGDYFTCSYEVRSQVGNESKRAILKQLCKETFRTPHAGHYKARELARLLIDLLIDSPRSDF